MGAKTRQAVWLGGAARNPRSAGCDAAPFSKFPYTHRLYEQRSIFTHASFVMEKPEIDEKLTLLTDFGKTEAICVEVADDPSAKESVLLKVMARGPFEQGQQCWIVDRDGSKIGATVENVLQQTIDSEVTLSTVLPS